MGLIIFSLLALICFSYLIKFYFWWKNRNVSSDIETIYKRKELISNKVDQRLLELSSNKERGILAPSTPNDFDFYVSTSDRACIIGPPGTGKTSFLVNQIYKWTDTGKSFVCLDIKPEIHSITKAELEKKGYRCIVYNPTSPVDNYDFLQDLDSPETIGEFVSALIPSLDSDNAVFSDTARDLLDALINHFRALNLQRIKKEEARSQKKGVDPEPIEKTTLPQVFDHLIKYDNITALFNDLEHSPSKMTRGIVNSLKMTASNERLLGSIITTLNTKLRFLRYDSIRESLNGGFSLKELSKPKTALFLQFEESKTETIGHLFSVFVGHLLRYLITNFEEREEVFCLLDEIGNAGYINDLTGKLNTIRSRNMPTWMYWQSKEQMQKYGKASDEGVNIIMGACDLQICFRLNDNATAKWFSDRVGSHIVKYKGRSWGYNVTDDSSTVGNSWGLNREEIIFPHELQQLGDGEVVAVYRGVAWKGKATPYWNMGESKDFEPDFTDDDYLKTLHSNISSDTANKGDIDELTPFVNELGRYANIYSKIFKKKANRFGVKLKGKYSEYKRKRGI